MDGKITLDGFIRVKMRIVPRDPRGSGTFQRRTLRCTLEDESA